MKKCPNCNSPMIESNKTNASYCLQCGTWDKGESQLSNIRHDQIASDETPIQSIKVTMDEKTFPIFMKEMQDENSPLRQAMEKADGEEEELCRIMNEAVTRMSKDTETPIPLTIAPPVTPVTPVSAQANLVRYHAPAPASIPPATEAYAETLKTRTAHEKQAKYQAIQTLARKAEKEKDQRAIQLMILKLSAEILQAIKTKGDFAVTLPVDLSELNNKNDNYTVVKKYFTDLGYQVSASRREGNKMCIFVGWNNRWIQ